MTLDGLESIGDIERLECDSVEIKSLLKKAETRLIDSKAENISSGARFEQAYIVVLTCATIALRALNYRIKKKREHHYITIETLRHTLQLDRKTVDFFQSLRELRHRDCYAPYFILMERDLTGAIEDAGSLLDKTKEWLKKNHPQLIE